MSPKVNPTEYDNRRDVNQSRKAWVPPAESARISTFRPAWFPADIRGAAPTLSG